MVQQGYKDTPVGVIPNDWEVVKLGDILEYEQPTKYLIKNDDYNVNYKTPVLTAGKTFILGYTDEINYIYTNLPVIIFDDFTTSNHYVNFEFKIKSSAMKLLTTKKHNLKYVYEQMQLIKFCLGIEHKRYWISEYSQIKIPLPPMLEQTKIAEILSTWDEAIKTQEALIEQKNIQKKGIMQQLFNQTIRFKDDLGNDYPAWQTAKLGDICEFINGKAHENEISDKGKYIVINSKFISTNGNIKKYTNKLISPIKKDSIVMVMSDVPNGKALAKCYYIDVNNKYTLNQRICCLVSLKINMKFMYFIINRNKYFLEFDSGVGQTNLKKDDILNCIIYIPKSLEEQTKIAQFLSAIDEEITTQEKILAQWKLQKKGLMQKLLTGQLRVKI